ncbi:MAG: hypothetical protein NTX17_04680 [Candidatus Eisenbacteria bacterium]|nr:hypothetical protein [Candidatus Eisenbacteria bacterium]
MTVEVPQYDGSGWSTIGLVRPRENTSTFLVELDESTVPLVEKFGLRIKWLGKHEIDQVALYKRRVVPFTSRALEPSEATQSTQSGLGMSMLSKLASCDSRCVELRPGQTLTLAFPFEEPSPGQVREIFFSSYGGYATLQAEQTAAVHTAVAITSCVPNPFAASTKLEVSLRGRTARLTVDIFDCAGRFVRRIFDGNAEQRDQTLQWDGRDEAGNTVRCGVYLCRTRFGKEEAAKKVVFIR